MLRILNISHLGACFSEERLGREFANCGHEFIARLASQIRIEVGEKGYCFFDHSGSLGQFDLILLRISAPFLTSYASLLSDIRRAGVRAINTPESLNVSASKAETFLAFERHNVPTPASVRISSYDQIEPALAQLNNQFPLILKLSHSCKGLGTMLVESLRSARSVTGTFVTLGYEVVLQEFISHSAGRDIRCFVVGNRVVAAMERSAGNAEEFRSNLHIGGTARRVELTSELAELAVRAASAVGAEIAGVDILEDVSGYKVIEVNGSPGLEGIEKTSGVNVAAAVVQYCLNPCMHSDLRDS